MLPQLEAFLEVAKRQNLSRAAEALYVSQPTVTARLLISCPDRPGIVAAVSSFLFPGRAASPVVF